MKAKENLVKQYGCPKKKFPNDWFNYVRDGGFQFCYRKVTSTADTSTSTDEFRNVLLKDNWILQTMSYQDFLSLQSYVGMMKSWPRDESNGKVFFLQLGNRSSSPEPLPASLLVAHNFVFKAKNTDPLSQHLNLFYSLVSHYVSPTSWCLHQVWLFHKLQLK